MRDLRWDRRSTSDCSLMSFIRHVFHICGIYEKFINAIYDIFLDIICEVCYNTKYEKNRKNENDNHGNARRETSKLT